MTPRKRSKSPAKTEREAMLYDLVESAVEKLDVLGSRIEGLDKKLDLHIQKTEFEFQGLKELDSQQNKILEEHHQRSTELKRDNDLKEKELKDLLDKKESALKTEIAGLTRRMARVEVPQKFLDWARKIFVWIAAASGAVVAFSAFIHWLRGA